MNQFADSIVDDYIDLLLRDAAMRLGIGFMNTKPKDWGLLVNNSTDNVKKHLDSLKKAAYAVTYLLHPIRLTKSFSEYFEYRTKLMFDWKIFVTNSHGTKVTLISVFRYKLARFKSNFNYHTKTKYNFTISIGENETGGKGKQLKTIRSHTEQLLRRKFKRRYKKDHGNRSFFLNVWKINGEKCVMVRETLCKDLFLYTLPADIYYFSL